MASMDDLVSTLSGVHAGQKGNDLQDLRNKLTQTLQPALPSYRPIPPPTSTHTIPTHATTGPMPPPAPVSSWNSPPPLNNYLGGINSSPSFLSKIGQGTSPRQGPYFPGTAGPSSGSSSSSNSKAQRETGFQPGSWANDRSKQGGAGVPGPRQGEQFGRQQQQAGGDRPDAAKVYPHAEVIPSRAGAMDTGAFEDDAFAPLYTDGTGRRNMNGSSGR